MIADSQLSHTVVRVYAEDSHGREHLLASMMATPIQIQHAPDQPVIHFEERHSGSPNAIESWFYQGDGTG